MKYKLFKYPLILGINLLVIQSLFSLDLSLIGSPAPKFELTDISSSTDKIKLSNFKGKLLLINFWASWCGPCRAELPTLNRIQEKYKNRNFTVLGLAVEDKPFVKKFLDTQSLELNYPITVGKGEASKVMTLYGNPDGLLPLSVLISPRQEILAIYPGILSEIKMNRILNRLLNDF